MDKVANYKGKEKQDPEATLLRSLINDGIKSGVVKPLPRHIFNWDQAEEAFRFMATGKHIGKVLMKMANNETTTNSNELEPSIFPPINQINPAVKRISFEPAKSYVVIGGLGGIGLEICYWLVSKGARNIIIASRSGVKSAYHTFCINRLQQLGANVLVSNLDVSDMSNAVKLIDLAKNLAPVGGIFNLAMTLKDALFEDQTKEFFEECCSIKVNGTNNLDIVSRNACPELDHFVCFSSLVSLVGNGGQSNYGYANSFMENICSQRKKDNYPALAVAWGAVGDVGHVAENIGHDIQVAGTVPQRINSCIDVLQRSLYLDHSCIASLIPFVRSSFEVKGDLLATILNVLGIKNRDKLDPKSTLGDLGLDSLMAVEIKQILEKKHDKVMSTKEIRELTIEQIKAFQDENSIENPDDMMKEIMQVDLSLPKNVVEVMYNIDSHDAQNPIFVFPPIEGLWTAMESMLKELSKKTNRPLVALNWVKECDNADKFNDVAILYLDEISKRYPGLKSYDLVAYSFGTMIALEMGFVLQHRGNQEGTNGDQVVRVRTLTILDSSPAYARPYLSSEHKTEAGESYTDMVSNFVREQIKKGKMFFNVKVTSIPDDDPAFKEWLDKFNKATANKWSEEEIIQAIDRVRMKFKLILEYNPKGKLQLDIKLIRATVGYNPQVDKTMPHDYKLSDIVSGNIEIVKVTGDHKTFLGLNSDRIADEIIAYVNK